MAEDQEAALPAPPAPESLARRADHYRSEVEKVVRTVGEHPLYELKRSCDLSNLFQKIEFVKDIQSIATSRIEYEKYMVIGADDATKTFAPVSNAAEFDEARLRQLLERYLHPCPQFEVFNLKTSDDVPFVLLVIGRQKTRCILARTTVPGSDLKPGLLLREGDLWTKGDSTGKRLARREDWDEIYEEFIERESEARARRRTDQVIQQAIAQERLRITSGTAVALPAHLSDEEFKAFVENICLNEDQKRLDLFLERLRDELIEGWHSCGAYDGEPIVKDPQSIPSLRAAYRIYRDDRFLPAMQRLTSLGLLIVKNEGPGCFFQKTMSLLRETYNASHELNGLRLATARGTTSKHIEEHLSHTTVALESLLSTYVIGAYITKRRRFAYLRTLLNQPVRTAGIDLDRTTKKQLLAMWPLHSGWGEPAGLKYRAGRIELCRSKIMNDPAFSSLFGDEARALETLIQFEFLVELNSYLAIEQSTAPRVADFMRTRYPDIDFSFWPSLIAFDLKNLAPLVAELFASLEEGLTGPLVSTTLLDDPLFVISLDENMLSALFLQCLRALDDDHEQWMLEMRRAPFFAPWPRELSDALRALPPRKK